MKKLTRLMLIGLPLLAFSSVSFSAKDAQASGLLIKSKYKKEVSAFLNDNFPTSISSGESYPLGSMSQKESGTLTLKDIATGKLLGKYRITIDTNSASTLKIEDLSPKTPDAPELSAEPGNQTVDSNGKSAEQPTIVLNDSELPPNNSSDESNTPSL